MGQGTNMGEQDDDDRKTGHLQFFTHRGGTRHRALRGTFRTRLPASCWFCPDDPFPSRGGATGARIKRECSSLAGARLPFPSGYSVLKSSSEIFSPAFLRSFVRSELSITLTWILYADE